MARTLSIASPWIPLQWVLCALLPVLVAACEPPAPRPPASMTAGITGYNFTSEGVQEFYVNSSYGSNLPPYGGGGATSCCVSLPEKWRPDLTVKVDWTIGHWTTPYASRKDLSVEEQVKCCFTERSLTKTVPIEPYTKEGGRLQVFFLPNDEIKVYVSNYGLGHEKHPSGMAYPKNPNPEK